MAYGSGDWALSSFGTLRQIFYAIFLTDAVGLEPRIASVAVLVGITWDAINDPLVGTLSDRVTTRWGRRRPFSLLFSIPFGLGFLLLWWAPPWESQLGLMLHVTLAYMISDTLQTLVSVPFYALTPEMTADYDERTTLTSYRMFFNLMASLAAAVLAPGIVDEALAAGFTLRQGYLAVAALFGGLAIVPSCSSAPLSSPGSIPSPGSGTRTHAGCWCAGGSAIAGSDRRDGAGWQGQPHSYPPGRDLPGGRLVWASGRRSSLCWEVV